MNFVVIFYQYAFHFFYRNSNSFARMLWKNFVNNLVFVKCRVFLDSQGMRKLSNQRFSLQLMCSYMRARVHDRLWIGPRFAAVDITQLKKCGITHMYHIYTQYILLLTIYNEYIVSPAMEQRRFIIWSGCVSFHPIFFKL